MANGSMHRPEFRQYLRLSQFRAQALFTFTRCTRALRQANRSKYRTNRPYGREQVEQWFYPCVPKPLSRD